MHSARALRAVDLRRRRIVGVEAAPVIAAYLPVLALASLKPHRLPEQALAAHRRVAVRTHPLEALQRMLAWDLRRLGPQWRIFDGCAHELVLQPLRIGE